jgi:glycosyltransferase involved in cell wall biosynthesis
MPKNNPVIFNLLPSENLGGMEQVFLDYCEIQKKNDYEIFAIIPKRFQYFASLKKLEIPYLILNVKGHYDLFANIKLFFLIKKLRAKIIIGHNGRAFAAMSLLRKFIKNVKFLPICHGASFKRIAKFENIIAVSENIKQELISSGCKNDIALINNALKNINQEIPQFNFQDKDKITFGVFSRLSHEKNIKLAINAIAELKQRSKKIIKLKIAGKGPELQNLQELVKAKNLDDNVEFLGWLDSAKEFFQQIDIFLLPSFNEPFGLTILESFNFGKPVIAANNGGPKYIINDQKDGLLFENNNLSDLVQIMQYTCDKDNLAKLAQLTKNAQNNLQKNYNSTKQSTMILDYIKKFQ